MKSVFLLSLLSIFFITAKAQVAPEEITGYLQTQKFSIDTGASAIILKEILKIDLSVVNGRYAITRHVYKLIKIVKKDAFGEADVKLRFPDRSYNSEVYNVKGATYNLDAVSVKKASLPATDFYTTKLTKQYYQVNFTMPDVKEGSIIEYSYDLISPLYYNLPVWHIDGRYPKLYTEYDVNNQTIARYHTILQISSKIRDLASADAARKSADSFVHYSDGKGYNLWIKRNVPAADEREPYVRNYENYRERLECRLVTYNIYGNGQQHLDDWDKFSAFMWASDEAKCIRDRYLWLQDTVTKLTQSKATDLEKAHSIYNYLRANFKQNENTLATSDVKSVFNSRDGSAMQLNCLLGAMLKAAGLEVYLLCTSSTEDISPSAVFPMLERFTRFRCALVINNNFIFLDASDKNNVFGMLPLDCYNVYSRIISKQGEALQLSPDVIEDANVRSVKITMPDDKTQQMEMTYKMGIVTSCYLRKQLAEKSTDIEKYTAKMVAETGEDFTVVEKHFENMDLPDTNLVYKITCTRSIDANPETYFAPTSFMKLMSQNPFRANKRHFPIEFSCMHSDAFYLNMTLPKGYTIDSMPNPKTLSLEEGSLEYKKTLNYIPEMNMLTANVTLKNRKVFYEPEEYEYFKAFYNDVMKEENGVVEIKKKK